MTFLKIMLTKQIKNKHFMREIFLKMTQNLDFYKKKLFMLNLTAQTQKTLSKKT